MKKMALSSLLAVMSGITSKARADENIAVMPVPMVNLATGIEVSATSGADHLDAGFRYTLVFDAEVVGIGGALQQLFPQPTSLEAVAATFGISLDEGFQIAGSNPSGAHPLEPFGIDYAGQCEVSGQTISLGFRVEASVSSVGEASLQITDVTIEPTAIAGELRLVSGEARLRRTCIGDLNGDWQVSFPDLVRLLGDWDTDSAASDVDASGHVDFRDLNLLVGMFQQPCIQSVAGLPLLFVDTNPTSGRLLSWTEDGTTGPTQFEAWGTRDADGAPQVITEIRILNRETLTRIELDSESGLPSRISGLQSDWAVRLTWQTQEDGTVMGVALWYDRKSFGIIPVAIPAAKSPLDPVAHEAFVADEDDSLGREGVSSVFREFRVTTSDGTPIPGLQLEAHLLKSDGSVLVGQIGADAIREVGDGIYRVEVPNPCAERQSLEEQIGVIRDYAAQFCDVYDYASYAALAAALLTTGVGAPVSLGVVLSQGFCLGIDRWSEFDYHNYGAASAWIARQFEDYSDWPTLAQLEVTAAIQASTGERLVFADNIVANVNLCDQSANNEVVPVDEELQLPVGQWIFWDLDVQWQIIPAGFWELDQPRYVRLSTISGHYRQGAAGAESGFYGCAFDGSVGVSPYGVSQCILHGATEYGTPCGSNCCIPPVAGRFQMGPYQPGNFVCDLAGYSGQVLWIRLGVTPYWNPIGMTIVP